MEIPLESQESSIVSVAPSESISFTGSSSSNNREAPKPTTARKATCWYFFHYPTDTTVKTLKCYFCKAAVTFNKASSTNLTAHAKKHKRLYDNFVNNVEANSGPIQKQISYNSAPRYDF